MTNNIKYEEAMHQLEQIANRMENGNIDVDELSAELKNARKLIKLCKDRLTKTDAVVKAILAEDE